MFRTAFTLALITFISACSTQPKPIATKPAIRTIAIVPATNPSKYTLRNQSPMAFLIPISDAVNYMDSNAKGKLLNEKFQAQDSSLANDLTETVAEGLRSRGYGVEIISSVVRSPTDLDDVKVADISTSADVILQLHFTEVGLFSPRSSVNYLPRVNAKGTLYLPHHEDDFYDEDFEYGVDASADKRTTVVADQKFAYPDFDAVIANLDGVRKVFQIGARELGSRISEQVATSIK